MVDYLPFASSATRQPDRQKPRPIPADVRRVIRLMTWGDDTNPDALPLDMIAACAAAKVAAYRMRRYLTRPAVIAYLRAEARMFREVTCCGNTAALRKVRDTSPTEWRSLPVCGRWMECKPRKQGERMPHRLVSTARRVL